MEVIQNAQTSGKGVTREIVRVIPVMSVQYHIWPQTDDNGNAMFQSYLSKLFKKETG